MLAWRVRPKWRSRTHSTPWTDRKMNPKTAVAVNSPLNNRPFEAFRGLRAIKKVRPLKRRINVFTEVISRGRRGWPGGGQGTGLKRNITKELMSPEKNMISAMMNRMIPSLAGSMRRSEGGPAVGGELETGPSILEEPSEEIDGIVADIRDKKKDQDAEQDTRDDHNPIDDFSLRFQVHVLKKDQARHD